MTSSVGRLVGTNLFEEPVISGSATYAYILCGWRTHSEIPLTGLPSLASDAGNPDVLIQVGTGQSPIASGRHAIAQITSRLAFQHAPRYSLIKIADVADFEIKAGRQIRFWPAPEATRKEIEIFLLGQVWSTLCHQRGMLPLHASAIVAKNRITAFAGPSGAGKSTIAALLNAFGYELLADDVLPVSFNQYSVPGAWPYLRRLKLHLDPITQLGFMPTETVSERLDCEKYFVHPKRTADDKWRRFERLYLLENDTTDSRDPIEQITGADAVRALVDQTHYFDFIRGTQRFGDHLAFCTQLVSKILIYRLRILPLDVLGELNELRQTLGPLICTHLEAAEQQVGPPSKVLEL